MNGDGDRITAVASKIEKLADRAEHGDQDATKMLTDTFKNVTALDLIDIYHKVNKDAGVFGTTANIETEKDGTPIAISFHPSAAERAKAAWTKKPLQDVQVKLVDQNYCLSIPCL